MIRRNFVLFLLVITVLAPIALFTNRLGKFTSSLAVQEFVEDEHSTLSVRSDKLNVLHQDSSTSIKEPIGIVYADESDSESKETLLEPGEHKSRVLSSATDDGSRHSGAASDGTKIHIQQVTDVVSDTKSETLQESDGNNEIGGESKESLVQEENVGSGDSSSVAKVQGENVEIPENLSSEKKAEETIGKSPRKKRGTGLQRSQPVKADEKLTNPETMPDARIRIMKDQLIRAKVYQSLSPTRNSPHFIRELRLRVKELQRALGDTTKDSELPRSANDKMKAMEQTLTKGKEIQDDCSSFVKKLRAMLHSTEEQLRAQKKQTLFLTQLAAKTLPKGLHCLPLRLSSEYYSLNKTRREFPNQEKLEDPSLYHYAIFSDNILAAAVVVTSTVRNAKEPEKHVFHIVTDRLNYVAMRMWFIANPPGKATIQIQNIEELTWLNSSYSPVLQQLSSSSMIDYYFKTHRSNSDPNLKYRNPKYLSMLNHLRFYLPQIFPKLNKVLFLDDDVVVQKDLTPLWGIDLKGMINGAVETCEGSFHRFDKYLNFSNPLIAKHFNPRACGWAYGMNVFDLEEWKRQKITDVYHSWQRLNSDRQLWKLGTLPPGLITFWKKTFTLDRTWHVLGLGYNPNLDEREISHAAVIHYNGNMKPWLEIGIPKYRHYWSRYINYDQVYLQDCNINP